MSGRNSHLAAAPQPALIVTHGNTTNRHRTLKGDTMILGRARGCDVRLEAPDISEIHCVLTRLGDGLHIRDCNSRNGTRVNGDPVKDAVLQDGDVLQIGLFSFQVSLPGGGGAAPASTPVENVAHAAEPLTRLQRSRQRLVQLALALRRRLRRERVARKVQGDKSAAQRQAEIEQAATATKTTAKRQAEIEQAAEALRGQQSACEKRAGQLAQAERDLARNRALLDQERAALEEARQQVAAREKKLEAEAHTQAEEWQRRSQEFEQKLAELRTAHRGNDKSAGKGRSVFEAEAEKPEVAAKRSKQIARYLLGTYLPGAQKESESPGDEVLDAAEPQEHGAGEERIQRSAGQTGGASVASRTVPAELVRELEALRAENGRLQKVVAERERAAAVVAARPVPAELVRELESLRAENGRLQKVVAERERAAAVVAARPVPAELVRELESLRVENGRLQKVVAERERAAAVASASGTQAEALRRELARLTAQLAEKEALLESARQSQGRETAEPADVALEAEKYEAELNEFRRQLEADRQGLDAEMRELQERKAELDETIRNEELSLSRERAQLARERVQLDQMRDMLKLDLERADREGEVRKRLAGLQRPR
jgi:pSer/pThr/pTyr-binding forkhead associated (FHA) protein